MPDRGCGRFAALDAGAARARTRWARGGGGRGRARGGIGGRRARGGRAAASAAGGRGDHRGCHGRSADARRPTVNNPSPVVSRSAERTRTVSTGDDSARPGAPVSRHRARHASRHPARHAARRVTPTASGPAPSETGASHPAREPRAPASRRSRALVFDNLHSHDLVTPWTLRVPRSPDRTLALAADRVPGVVPASLRGHVQRAVPRLSDPAGHGVGPGYGPGALFGA